MQHLAWNLQVGSLAGFEQLNKKCYMAELDSKYCDIIVQRYINFMGTSDDVYLTRNNKRIEYDNVKEV